jgi:hypothetical protein
MSAAGAAVPLLLQRVPDARRAPWPLLPAVFLPYVALMLGAGAAAAAALYNAVALRRARLGLIALAVGLAGWAGFGFVALPAIRGGIRSPGLVILPATLVNVALGALLAWSQWAHLRGHEFLEGRTVPLLSAVLATFAAALLIPRRVQLVLEGLWPLLLR